MRLTRTRRWQTNRVIAAAELTLRNGFCLRLAVISYAEVSGLAWESAADAVEARRWLDANVSGEPETDMMGSRLRLSGIRTKSLQQRRHDGVLLRLVLSSR